MNRRQLIGSGAGLVASRALGAEARPRAPFRVIYSNDTTNITSCVSPFHAAREPFRREQTGGEMGLLLHLLETHLPTP
jgi:hypothetical protein